MSSNATGDVPPDPTAGTGPEAPADARAAEPDPEAAADLAADAEDGEDTDHGHDTTPEAEAGERAEPVEENDPAELIDTLAEIEPVEFAEPIGAHEPARRGHGVLLTVGFVLAGIAIIGGAIAIVGSLTHGFKKPVKVTYKKSAVFSLRAGECIDPHGQTASIVACGTPHNAEVFATFTLPDSKWPGDSAVQAAASSGCATRLTAYLNPQLAISLTSTYVYPDAVAWQAGTRTVICEVQAASGLLTGSVRGATATAG